jgi:hypothetical protein
MQRLGMENLNPRPHLSLDLVDEKSHRLTFNIVGGFWKVELFRPRMRDFYLSLKELGIGHHLENYRFSVFFIVNCCHDCLVAIAAATQRNSVQVLRIVCSGRRRDV